MSPGFQAKTVVKSLTDLLNSFEISFNLVLANVWVSFYFILFLGESESTRQAVEYPSAQPLTTSMICMRLKVKRTVMGCVSLPTGLSSGV